MNWEATGEWEWAVAVGAVSAQVGFGFSILAEAAAECCLGTFRVQQRRKAYQA